MASENHKPTKSRTGAGKTRDKSKSPIKGSIPVISTIDQVIASYNLKEGTEGWKEPIADI